MSIIKHELHHDASVILLYPSLHTHYRLIPVLYYNFQNFIIIYYAGCNIRENTSLACDDVIMHKNTDDIKDTNIQARMTQ